MKITKALIVITYLFSFFSQVVAQEGVHLEKVHNNLCDKASLQRGAGLYVNYCIGCHSLQFVRFENMAKDIGITDKKGEVLEKLVAQNLNFISDRMTDPMNSAIPKTEAAAWFGVAPPDLSLVSRTRGKNWLYTYLKSFYADPKRPWGVNNLVYPDVAMPHILLTLQGLQEPVYTSAKIMDEQGNASEKKVIDHLELKAPGSLSEAEYDKAVTDLVNFLDYIGEPQKLERKRLGVWVVLFLVVFTLFAYLLKREYWKDVK